MNRYCTSELSLEKNHLHQLRLEFNDEGIYGTSLSVFAPPGVCEATIEGRYASFPKLMFYFEYLDLECENGYLQFFDGLNGTTKVPGRILNVFYIIFFLFLRSPRFALLNKTFNIFNFQQLSLSKSFVSLYSIIQTYFEFA